MADVGPLLARDSGDTRVLGGLGPDSIQARSMSDWIAGNKFFTRAVNGLVSGIVKELGTPIADKIVRCYDRFTGEFLNETTSAGDGTFSMSALGRSTVYVVAFDSPYNAKIFDNVTPEP